MYFQQSWVGAYRFLAQRVIIAAISRVLWTTVRLCNMRWSIAAAEDADHTQWRSQKFQLGGSSPFPSIPPSLFCFSSLVPLFYPSLPFFVFPLLLPSFSPSFPLKVKPQNPARRSGGALRAPPAGCGAEPQPKSNLVHFSFKRWDLVAAILIISSKINWPNWQILCILYVCLCFVWRIGGLGSLAPLGYATDHTIGEVAIKTCVFAKTVISSFTLFNVLNVGYYFYSQLFSALQLSLICGVVILRVFFSRAVVHDLCSYSFRNRRRSPPPLRPRTATNR